MTPQRSSPGVVFWQRIASRKVPNAMDPPREGGNGTEERMAALFVTLGCKRGKRLGLLIGRGGQCPISQLSRPGNQGSKYRTL